jgi:hypothetical protein
MSRKREPTLDQAFGDGRTQIATTNDRDLLVHADDLSEGKQNT